MLPSRSSSLPLLHCGARTEDTELEEDEVDPPVTVMFTVHISPNHVEGDLYIFQAKGKGVEAPPLVGALALMEMYAVPFRGILLEREAELNPHTVLLAGFWEPSL